VLPILVDAGPRQIDLVADLPGTFKLAARLPEVLDACWMRKHFLAAWQKSFAGS
jgi:hypothetical protein